MRFQRYVRRSFFVLSLGSALAMIAACGEPAPPPPPVQTPATPAERANLYQSCWNMFNDKAWDKFQNCYTENAVSESADSTPASVTGRAAIIENAKAAAAAFPDRRGEVRLVLINGSHGATMALYTGTNTGPMPGPDGKPAPATNKAIGFLVAHTLELDAMGVAATRDVSYIDEGTLAAQLGLSPAPARPVQKPVGAAPLVVLAKNDATETANLAAMKASVDAINKHDLKALEPLMAEGYRMIEIGRPKDENKKETLASLKELFGGIPDVTITQSAMWAAGDYVVFTGTFSGTNTGDLPSAGIKKTGKKLSLHFCEIVKFEGGKQVEDYLFFNGAAFAAQLGLK